MGYRGVTASISFRLNKEKLKRLKERWWQSMLKGIVRVGAEGSEIKFNSIKMMRALSLSEVRNIANDDIAFVVIERAKESERETIENLATSLGKIKVYLYKSEFTSESLHSYNSLKELQRDVSFTYGVNVRTYKVGVDEEEREHQAELERLAEEKRRIEEEQKRIEEVQKALENPEEFEDTSDIEDEFGSLFDEGSDDIGDDIFGDGTDIFGGPAEVETKEPEQDTELEEDGLEEASEQVLDVDDTSDEDENAKELAEALNVPEDIEEPEHFEEKKAISIKAENKFTWDDTEEDEGVVDSEEVASLQRLLSVTEGRLTNLIAIRDSLQDKVAFYEGLIRKVEVQENIVDVQTKDSEETLAKLSEYKLIVRDLENKLADLQSQLATIDGLHIEIDNKNSEIEGLKKSLADARTDDKYKEVQGKLELERDIRQQMNGVLIRVITDYEVIASELAEHQAKVKGLSESNSSLTEKVVEATRKLEDFKGQKETQVRKLSEKIRMLNLQLDEYNKKLNEGGNELRKIHKEKEEALTAKLQAEIDRDRIKEELVETRGKLKSTNDDLEVQLGVIGQLREKLKKFEELDVEKLQEDIRVGDIGQTQLMQQLGRVQKELQAAKYQISNRDETISRLQDENSRLTITNKGLSRSAATAESLTIDIQYRGRASIIAVFGTGGSGTTTTAVSLAERLDGSVLLLDFDCAKPSIDGFAGMNPMIKDLPELPVMDQSAFGALIKKGTDYVIDNRDSIVRRMGGIKNRDGVYYFSGVYTKIDLSEFLSIEFDQFLNFFGNEYKYIVVDLGSITGSESNLSLIRAFNNIAWRNILVCRHDKFDIRLAKIKASSNKIMYNKTNWILNFANNTKLDPSMEKALRGMNYSFMAREMQYFGERRKFSEFGNPNKDRIRELAEMVRC